MGELEYSYDAIWKSILDKDEETAYHCLRVSNTAYVLAKGVTQDANIIKVAGLLHDLGKIALDDKILKGNLRFSEDGKEVVKPHPFLGYRLARKYDLNQKILNGILYHHERYDGTGYPHALSGDKIPIEARYIAICDVFCALNEHRSYRDEINTDKALDVLKKNKKEYDPNIYNLFMSRIEDIIQVLNSSKFIFDRMKREV